MLVFLGHTLKSDLFSLLPSFFSQTNIFSVYWLKLHVSLFTLFCSMNHIFKICEVQYTLKVVLQCALQRQLINCWIGSSSCLTETKWQIFFCQGFLLQAVTTHGTIGERRKRSLVLSTSLFATLHARWLRRIFIYLFIYLFIFSLTAVLKIFGILLEKYQWQRPSFCKLVWTI